MVHQRKSAYKADGIRAECDCGWVGKWHDANIRSTISTTEFSQHLRDVVDHGTERHQLFDLGDMGELFSHLTDDHDLPTAGVATWDYTERVERHFILHGLPAPASPS